ncbi:MAG TPA: carbohydrate ABC transporter permease, partial [Polyangiaceae bacterium]|nr:carbohydrate ABC transporter permease [Polyangiaceae bacterium]
MNTVQLLLLCVLAAGFLLLWFGGVKRRRLATAYARWVILGLASIAILSPFFWLVAACFKDRSVLNEYIFFPSLAVWSDQTINLSNFERLFEGKASVQGTIYFWQYLLNSTVYATVSTSVQLFFCSLAGYALAKYQFRGKKLLTGYMLGSMMIPGALLLAPIYSIFARWQLIDSLFGLMLPSLVTAYGIFLFRQACMSIPNELIEAGRIDGCGEFGIYFRLVMPLVRPMSAAFCLVSFLGNWNSFFTPNVFLHSQDKLTLPVVLNLYVAQYH